MLETKGHDQCLQLKSLLFCAIDIQQPSHFGQQSVPRAIFSSGFVLCPVHSLKVGNKRQPSQQTEFCLLLFAATTENTRFPHLYFLIPYDAVSPRCEISSVYPNCIFRAITMWAHRENNAWFFIKKKKRNYNHNRSDSCVEKEKNTWRASVYFYFPSSLL